MQTDRSARYTLTYNPALDPELPTTSELHVKVKNTSAIPLRAAYLHGPYTLYTACCPTTFDPNTKFSGEQSQGIPQFEPYLKAGGNWDAVIPVPEHLRRQQAALNDQNNHNESVTWIIEVSSQVIFSTTAAVHYEILVGRDEKSVNVTPELHLPAQLREHWLSSRKGDTVTVTKGVFSRSIVLDVDDTASLWNSPPFPLFEEKERARREAKYTPRSSQESAAGPTADQGDDDRRKEKTRKKKVHFVVLTHGLHSNLGADMLYMKESIDVAARGARESRARERRKAKQRDKAVAGDPKR